MTQNLSPTPPRKIAVALVQTSSHRDIQANMREVREAVLQAQEKLQERHPNLPKLILTPENVLMIEPDTSRALRQAQTESDHQGIKFFADLAKQTQATILAGSLSIRHDSKEKLSNRSYLFNPSGQTIAQYSKIHLFDVDLPNGETYRESNLYVAGGEAILHENPMGKFGLTICYDIRFAMLYRALARAGAEVIFVPAAFTATTGRAHWHVLLRARAIECGCFILAPAQTGTHAEGRQTYGHSLVINPWGEILADGGDAIGVVTAEIDLAEVAATRARIPSLQHDRNFLVSA
ncbi:MAG: carbon-nitrogen hydrolase family protein [Alphaproteobacteria bacterium]|nr:carbon-nitrogen hydrolase family protein [Alphaproteobacteria bacterium]